MLNMEGHIDDVFESTGATRTPKTVEYVNGLPVSTNGTPSPHSVTLQTVSDRKLESLVKGGERIVDARKVYVNDGDLYSIAPSDRWSFDGVDGVFKSVNTDNRPWRNYCRLIVSREDE